MFNKEEKDIIEQLKHNWKIFGGCSKEEQEVFKKIGKKNCLCAVGFIEGKAWVFAGESSWHYAFCYRIKPDFTPGPELTDYEVFLLHNGRYGIAIVSTTAILTLSDVVAMPGFRGFYATNSKTRVNIENVVRVIEVDKLHVVARFEE